MDLDKIRNMSDKDLKEFLSNIKSKNHCDKCGNIIDKKDRKVINVTVYDRYSGQKSKKLCCLCDNCYSDMLDHLSVCDVDWGDED